MSTITRNCLHCQQEFKARSQDVKRGFAKFCSQSCSSIYNRAQETKPEPNVECAYCQTKFYLNTTQKSRSKSGLYFCCRKHKDLAQQIGGVVGMQLPHYKTRITHYMDKALHNKPPKCERCGYDEHIAAIVIHHKDRNRDNNSLSNLEVLCAICHAIEHWVEDIQLRTPSA